MAKIEGFRIINYKALRDITLGKLCNTKDRDTKPLTPMTAVIGKNGVGKSTLFDAFCFLSDCLKGGVEEACDSRGGFERIRSQGEEGSIEFEVYYKEDCNARGIGYELAIALDSSGIPYIKKERLRQLRSGQKTGLPLSFLMLNDGEGIVWKGEAEGKQVEEDKGQFDLSKFIERIEKGEAEEESKETELVELDDKRKLGIATLG